VQLEPAVGDGAIKAGLVFRGCAFELIEERRVDLLDIDPAVLHWLEGLASSTSLRTAVSGLMNGQSAANFTAPGNGFSASV
jgi:hypothetical protein